MKRTMSVLEPQSDQGPRAKHSKEEEEEQEEDKEEDKEQENKEGDKEEKTDQDNKTEGREEKAEQGEEGEKPEKKDSTEKDSTKKDSTKKSGSNRSKGKAKGKLKVKDVNTLLRRAARKGDAMAMVSQLARGATAITDALLEACESGHKEIAYYFLSKGAGDIEGALEAACRGGQEDIALWLIDTYLARDLNRGVIGAARGGHLELIRLLESRGAETHSEVAFQMACNYGHVEVARHCFCADFSRDVLNSAWRKSIRSGNACLMKLLEQRSVTDFDGAFGAACVLGDREVIARYESKVQNFNDGLLGACESGEEELVERMLERGANEYCHALRICCELEHISLARRMIFLITTHDWKRPQEPDFAHHLDLAWLAIFETGHVELVEELLFLRDAFADDMSASRERWFRDGAALACVHGHVNMLHLMVSKSESPLPLLCVCMYEMCKAEIVTDAVWDQITQCDDPEYARVQLIEWGFRGACAGGRLSICTQLVADGARHFSDGLVRAAQNGHVGVVTWLLQRYSSHVVLSDAMVAAHRGLFRHTLSRPVSLSCQLGVLEVLGKYVSDVAQFTQAVEGIFEEAEVNTVHADFVLWFIENSVSLSYALKLCIQGGQHKVLLRLAEEYDLSEESLMEALTDGLDFLEFMQPRSIDTVRALSVLLSFLGPESIDTSWTKDLEQFLLQHGIAPEYFCRENVELHETVRRRNAEFCHHANTYLPQSLLDLCTQYGFC